MHAMNSSVDSNHSIQLPLCPVVASKLRAAELTGRKRWGLQQVHFRIQGKFCNIINHELRRRLQLCMVASWMTRTTEDP